MKRFNIIDNFKEFLKGQQLAGILLIFCTLISLVISNSPLGESYHHIWETPIKLSIGSFELNYHFIHWINDGLMAVFFLFVGLEIKRELIVGELSTTRKAILPIIVALGGMLFPAIFYAVINWGKPSISGFGIPTATDIAFALGVLSLLGNRIPMGLKIFLTALAVIDDLGAIIIIALFYGGEFHLNYFILSGIAFLVLFLLNYLNVKSLTLYLLIGIVLWFFMLKSGIHSTIAGVLLAVSIPQNEENSLGTYLAHQLENSVNFLIMPIFALANTAILINFDSSAEINWEIILGIFLGLILGKSIGISLSTYLAVKLKLTELPLNVNWIHVIGMGFLGGIGFTMSIFVSTLAFTNEGTISLAKLVIIISSTLAGLIGYLFLKKADNSK